MERRFMCCLLPRASHLDYCVRTSNYSLLAVSHPGGYSNVLRRMFCLLSLCYNFASVRLTLLFSGDVESNNGPSTQGQDATLVSVVATVQRIEHGQSEIMNEIKPLRTKQEKTDSREGCESYFTGRHLLPNVGCWKSWKCARGRYKLAKNNLK